MPVLLVIDDEASILEAFRATFDEPSVTVLTAGSAIEGLESARANRPDVVILDLDLPDLNGLEAFRRLQALDSRVPVIFVTGHGTTDTAIEAMKLGAFDYLLKPLELDQLRALIDRACNISRGMHVKAVTAEEPVPPEPSDVLVGRSPAMQEVYKTIGRVAPQDVTVLITGESGTGKELVARAIYHHSRRVEQPFLTINCAAIPETLLESELFGHEKGAFTGADRKRIGKFEQCNGGTLFLDEIGDMSLLTQTKILRVLQNQRFERVGGNETIQTNVRLLAATNRNLEQLVADGRFRGDLYYRLNVVTIHLPPLRERVQDLPLLVEHFLRRFSVDLGKEVTHAAPEAIDLLRYHAWPGNLRELQSVLKQALLQARGSILLANFLPVSLRKETKIADNGSSAGAPVAWDRFLDERLQAGSRSLHAEWLELTERHLLTRVLNQTRGNQLQAAKILGVSRNWLRTKIRMLGILIERSVWSEAAVPDSTVTS
jgi:two-component system nitrogen regulation response regulator GlnG